MKFSEIKEQSYFRDRNNEDYELDITEHSYFEELRVIHKEKDVMRAERIHIYIRYDDPIAVDTTARDELDFKKERWDRGAWNGIEWITESEMYRRALKYLFEGAE